MLFLAGLVGVTVCLLLSQAPPPLRYVGLVLVAGVLVSGAARAFGGQAAFGLAWLVVAGMLMRQSAGQPASGRRREPNQV